jgi:hypothetical protein
VSANIGDFPVHIRSVNIIIKVKVESRNRPGVARRDPGALDSQISMIFGT